MQLDFLACSFYIGGAPFSLLLSFRERAWTKGHGVVYRSYVAESERGVGPLRGAS